MIRKKITSGTQAKSHMQFTLNNFVTCDLLTTSLPHTSCNIGVNQTYHILEIFIGLI